MMVFVGRWAFLEACGWVREIRVTEIASQPLEIGVEEMRKPTGNAYSGTLIPWRGVIAPVSGCVAPQIALCSLPFRSSATARRAASCDLSRKAGQPSIIVSVAQQLGDCPIDADIMILQAERLSLTERGTSTYLSQSLHMASFYLILDNSPTFQLPLTLFLAVIHPQVAMSHSVPFHLEALHSTSRADMQNLNHKYEAGDLYDPFSQFRQAHSKSEEPRIPAASLFQTLAGPQDEEAAKGRHASPLLDMPSVGECAVHLELLEVFFAVRTRIINSSELDNTFDVKNKPRTVYRREIDRKTAKYTDVPHQIKDTNWPQRRRSKWIYYLHIAVGRFMFWARSADAAIKLSSKSGSSSTLVHIPPFGEFLYWFLTKLFGLIVF